jgi:hypothetical protein
MVPVVLIQIRYGSSCIPTRAARDQMTIVIDKHERVESVVLQFEEIARMVERITSESWISC